MGGLGPKVDENLVPEQLQALFQFLEGQYFCEPEQSLISQPFPKDLLHAKKQLGAAARRQLSAS